MDCPHPAHSKTPGSWWKTVMCEDRKWMTGSRNFLSLNRETVTQDSGKVYTLMRRVTITLTEGQ